MTAAPSPAAISSSVFGKRSNTTSILPKTVSEVQCGDIPDEPQELRDDRLIQADLLGKGSPLRLRRAERQHQCDWIAHQPCHDENSRCHAENDEYPLEQAADDEFQHMRHSCNRGDPCRETNPRQGRTPADGAIR